MFSRCSLLRSAARQATAHRRGWHVAPALLSPSLRRQYATDGKTIDVPRKARVVVVGGGIIGTSIAYHLAKLGGKAWADEGVVLLEQNQLTSGTTWHAAGLMVTFGSLSETSTTIRQYSKELYSTILPQETGQETGFMPVGFIELANHKDRVEEFRRVAAFNRKCGVDVEEIDANEVKKLFPLCRVDDIQAGFYVKDDGRVNPVDATMALAKGARLHGVNIIEGVRVSHVTRDRTHVNGVVLEDGREIQADYVVNAAGMWARQFGEICGVNIPLQAAEHYYLLTDAMPEVDPKWPVIEDPSSFTYIRPEGGGLMVGLFETLAASWRTDFIPGDFQFGELEPDWDRMTPFVEAAVNRVPDAAKVGAKKLFCGPESFTADLAPMLGEAPELRNYFVCAGLNSIGILTGGGIGRALAHWIVNGSPDVDITGMNIDRQHPYQRNEQYRAHRVVESLGKVYALHYPTVPMKTARNAKCTPFYERHKQLRNAYFRDVSGFETPDWYAPEGVEAVVLQHSWARENWFPYWEAEHHACRNNVAAIDMSFMSKFLVQGKDAGKVLNYMSTANVDDEAGRITYTQWLTKDGLMEADLTVTKLDAERYFVVATDTMHRHVQTLMQRAIDEADAFATVTDVTGAYAQVNVQGPRSRELMQHIVRNEHSMSNEDFPFRDVQEIAIGYARVYCARITYVGELGYELFIPVEHALHVHDVLEEAGKQFDLRWAGLKALASMRMEKGYRDYGHDMDNCDTLLEVGLGFTADFDKPGGFVGKEAVLKQKEGGVKALRNRLLSVLCLDAEPLMFHGEVLWRNGVRVGDIRAASYGHSLGGAVGLGLVEKELAECTAVSKKWLDAGEWEVEIAHKRYAAKVSLGPLYDLKNEKIKA